MAFASIGSRGTATSKTNGTTLSLSPSSAVAVGRLLVVWVAWDSAWNPGDPDGIFNRRLDIADSKDNVWSTLGSYNTGKGTNASSLGGLFVTRVRTQIETTDTITFTHQTSLVAKAMSAWEFSIAGDMRWATTDHGGVGPETAFNEPGDPGAISLDQLASQEYLLLHVLSTEGPSTDAYTWDADYTQITGAGTTGGADDSNITVEGGFRIATLTGDTVDVTSDTADRDNVQVMVALCEVPYDSAFPTLPVLDDFNRADENPLDNGTWNTGTCTPSFNNTRKLRIVSNVVASSDGTNGGGQWWLDSIEENDAEVFASIATAPTGASQGLSILLHGSGCGPLATRNGYEAAWRKKLSVGIYDRIEFGGAGNVSTVELFVVVARAIVAGKKLGIQRRDKVNHLWIDEGSGWEWAAAIYHNDGNQTFNSGLLGLQAYDSVTRIDDFGGGGSVFFVPQIYRRPRD